MERQQSRAVRRWIIALSQGQRCSLALLTAGRVVQGGLYVVVSLLTRGLIDCAVAADKPGAIRFGLWLLLTVLMGVALRTGLAILLRTTERRLQIKLRTRTFRALGRKKQSALAAYHSGVLLDRIQTDTPHVVESLVSIVPDLAGMSANLLGALGALYIMSGELTLALVAFGFVMAFLARFARKRVRAYYKDMSERSAKTSSFYLESLSHALLIKVFGAGERAAQRANELESKGYGSWRRWQVFNQLVKTGSSLFFQAGYYGALLLGASALFTQSISYGTLTAILQLVGQIQDPFAEIGYMVGLYNTSYAAAERMMELEALPDDPMEAPADPKAVYARMTSLRISRLTFGYHSEPVLKDCSCEIKKGDFAVVLGPSGAGKSTLEKLLLGVYDAFEGSIAVCTPDGDIPLGCATRGLFAYVPQGDMVITGSIRDNLTFLLGDMPDEEIEKALAISCADEFIRALPQGLDTPIGEHGVGLSEGQNQRLAIARAVLSGAPILLMDEATSALDADTEGRVLDSLRHLDGRTLILISHKEAAFGLCTTQIRIEQGQMTQRRLEP